MSEDVRIRILCVDDHPLMREGIAAIVGLQPDLQMVATCGDGATAIKLYREHRPDVTLMDLRLPDMSGIDVVIAIRAEFPEARLLVLSTFEGDIEMQRALQAGARGYLLKSMPPAELLQGIRDVHAGKKRIPPKVAATIAEHFADDGLTTREIEVLQQVAAGLRNREIADQLAIAEETVKVHVKHIMEKLAARDRTEAVAIGVRRGFIQL